MLRMLNATFFLKNVPLVSILLLLACCESPEHKTSEDTLFILHDPGQTGVHFVNELNHTETLNPYTFKSFYNGGGVGMGDFNNDGLLDIFFSGNLVSNKLYINKGNFKFEDVTATSGLSSEGIWTTGVSIADINSDGLPDIYICKSGPPGGQRRTNELFINNGDLTFSEKAKAYGLDFDGLSVHAAFFDFDRDGDLDCYLLNNSLRAVGGFDLRKNQRNIPDTTGGNRLLRNDNDHFVNVSEESGIYTSKIGFGLGVTIGDVNRDGWQDIFVSNDFFEKDYLYINNSDGTFKESLEDYMREISLGSMGADMADINNDGLPEIYVTEMLPESDVRLKTTSQFESWDKYSLSYEQGYFKQFSRNVLQLNNGDGTFSEISRMAGVHATDWSWGALIFDMDNDGLKDIFVANGIYKDLINQDYVSFIADPNTIREILRKEKTVVKRLVDSIPSNRLPNYAFHNNGDLSFTNEADKFGLAEPTHSNGSAYGDLDNDGDLDLVLNNVNMPSSVYENRSRQKIPSNHTLSVVLHGEGRNTFGVGATVTVLDSGRLFYQELSPMRGFMSTVDSRLHFGLGNTGTIDSVIIDWPDGRISKLYGLNPDQYLHVYQKDALPAQTLKRIPGLATPLFQSAGKIKGADYVHAENDFVDFDRDRLLFNMISNEGPCLCTGDINSDGLDDFYIGGAKGQAGALFVQLKPGGFRKTNEDIFEADKESEDTDCAFFDANNDGKPELYVTSGGNEFSSNSAALLDRLYFNSGNGGLVKSKQPLPVANAFESTSTVSAADFDLDGDIDLFVGSRLIPSFYGLPANGYLLSNDGKGHFLNVSDEIAPALRNLGLITDSKWADVNNDKAPDLLIAGEWMPLRLFMNENGKLVDRTEAWGFDRSNGWYHAIEVADFDNDGYLDIAGGNHGLNSRFKAGRETPVSLHVNDFDQNGNIEHILTRFEKGVALPLVLRQDLLMQIPALKKKYLHYGDYQGETIDEIFPSEVLAKSVVLNAYTFETAVWLNQGGKSFAKRNLPVQAQMAPVYAIMIRDFNKDGILDVFLGGNLYRAKPETGIYDAGYGLLLSGDGKGNFKPLSPGVTGIAIKGEIRAIAEITYKGKKLVVIARNNDKIEMLTY